MEHVFDHGTGKTWRRKTVATDQVKHTLSEAEPNSCSEVRNKGQAQNDWRENQQHFVASWIWGRRGGREISKTTNFYVR